MPKWDEYNAVLKTIVKYDALRMSEDSSIYDDIMTLNQTSENGLTVGILASIDLDSQATSGEKYPASVALLYRENYMNWLTAICVSLFDNRKVHEFYRVYSSYILDLKENYNLTHINVVTRSNIFEAALKTKIIERIMQLDNLTIGTIEFITNECISVYEELGKLFGDKDFIMGLPSAMGGTIADNIQDAIVSHFIGNN